MSDEMDTRDDVDRIAIIGMSGRFPGAPNVDQFWANLVDGVESIRYFSDQELAASGVDVKSVRGDPSYVRARGVIDGVDMLDARFFGINPREAQVMDPQHRVLLEEAWFALENAGYDPDRFDGLIGIYAGPGRNTYHQKNLLPHSGTLGAVDGLMAELGNVPDYLTTRISYKLNLRGPSVAVHTACSTSLVAVYHACHSLLTYQCDMALAGGVSIRLPQKSGYWSTEGDISSPDGHTRAFDADGQGTVFSNGAALVVLRRLEEAIEDGDRVVGVIRGIAINNDGAAKVGFGAPSVEGQAEVIAMAQAMAGVRPRDITYVECHGTGTPLGDPIEVAALTRAFRAGTQEKGFCALGSAKSNLGHLDAAAGVTGLIKTVLSLKHGIIAPTLHVRTPNPKFSIDETPFFINDRLREWPSGDAPRIAGVSSFGVGGTNAHAILEEPPAYAPSGPSRDRQLLVVSAKTAEAADEACANLADHLEKNADATPEWFADVAYTLQMGRNGMDHRRTLVSGSAPDAVAVLRDGGEQVKKGLRTRRDRAVVFLIPGQGAQYPNMGRAMYETEPTFRGHVDRCAEILDGHMAMDLRDVLYPDPAGEEEAARQLRETHITQPALFVVEYALAQQWMEWGVRPTSLVGHSIGEFVAACLAGVIDVEDSLGLLARRGQLMHELPSGGMLAISTKEAELHAILPDTLSLAAVNSPSSCVVSGPHGPLDAFQAELEEREVSARRLHTSHAFHSSMMDPIVDVFAREVEKVELRAPQIPFTSSVSGTWITAEQATDARYWASHLRHPVRFADARRLIAEEASESVLLEVGPGSTLSSLSNHPAFRSAKQRAISSLGHVLDERSESDRILEAVGSLWMEGVAVDWRAFWKRERRQRVALPPYPFERKQFWIAPPLTGDASAEDAGETLASGAGTVPPAIPEDAPSEAVAGDTRRERILAYIKEVMEDLGGVEPADVDEGTTFLDLGFDSLFLTQAGLALKKKFGIKVTLRQLLEDAPTPGALASFLDGSLEPDAPSHSPAPRSTPASMGAGAGSLALEGTVRQQLRVIASQLERLASSGADGGGETASPLVPRAETAQPIEDRKILGPWKPIDTADATELDDRRARALADLVARYTTRTSSSKALTAQHRTHLSDPRSVSGFRTTWKEMVYPIAAARSKGSRIWDIDGNEYIDLRSGFGSVFFGHSPDFVTRVIEEQLESGVQIGPTSPTVGQLAQAVCELTGMDRATFCNTGSEAVLATIRVARTVTGRDTVVVFSQDYHGMFDEVLVRGVGRTSPPRSRPIAPGIPDSAVDHMVVLEYGDPSALEWIAANGGTLAAVLVEPVQSRQPDLQPRDFLRSLREITRRTDTVLIFDEVITGFRLHPGGAQAWFGVDADLASYGKIIGGGMPVGVVAGRRRYMDALDGGHWQFGDASFPEVGVTYFAGTFQRHPLAMAAALAVTEELKREGPELQRSVGDRCDRMVARLNDHFRAVGAPVHVERCESMFSFRFAEEHEFTQLFYYYLRERGINIWPGGASFMTAAHTDADVDAVIQAVVGTVAEMQEGGFLAGGTASAASAAPSDASTESEECMVPLTEGQEEIWLALTAGGGAECAFNQSTRLELEGMLDAEALETALDQLVSRHEALRATFTQDGSRMVVVAIGAMQLTRVDLSSADDRAQKLRELAQHEVETPFDLVTGPLSRCVLIRLAHDHHVLFLTVHHIICDGWSSGLLLRDLGDLYAAQLEGRSPNLAPPTQITDYARQQDRERFSKESLESEAYWIDQFSDTIPKLDFPTDSVRPPLKTYGAALEELVLSQDLVAEVSRVASFHGCTLFMALFSVFEVFLSRLAQQSDFVIGVTAAGQLAAGSPNLVGHCVSLLPVRTRVNHEHTFTEHLQATRTRVLDSFERQNFTFGTLLKKLQVPRDPSRLPLVDVVFNMDSDLVELSYPGLIIEAGSNPHAFENFELFFNLVATDSGLRFECTYNTDLFRPATIRRRLEEFVVLLTGATAEPHTQLMALPLLTGEERNTLLVDWNRTGRDVREDAPPTGLFESQARQTADAEAVTDLSVVGRVRDRAAAHPDRAAVGGSGRQLTYGDLWTRSGRLAQYLIAHDLGRGAIVGVSMERCPEMMVALLGILRSGAAYLPLDPEFPADRLAFIVEDSGAQLVVTDGDAPTSWDAEAVTLTDAQRLGAESEGADEAAPAIKSEDLAYVLYTSGSTGQPKGVEVEHGNLVNFLESMATEPGLSEDDVLLAVTTLSFDIAGLELWLPLWVGARVVIAEQEETHDGRWLLERLEASEATVMQATPSTWRMLVESGWTSRLRKVLCGGESFPRDLVEPLRERADEVWNLYGPTETTIWSTAYRLEAVDGRPVPIGRPIANTQLYVMDAQGQLTPQGVQGELWIGGHGVARGYHSRADLTKDRFVASPFTEGARVYRTGDLVRWNDGLLEHLGRLDDQVKVHGHRIELGEIEAVLAGHDDVRQAVAAVKGTEGEARLVAFIVSEPGRPVIGSELRKFLRQRLPDYMIPGVISEIDTLPLTPNGKVDRQALPDPAASVTQRELVAPTTETEQQIADIWKSLLDLDQVSIHDNFFELGGYSLLAIRVAALLAEQFGLRIDPRSLFFQTLQQVATSIEHGER